MCFSTLYRSRPSASAFDFKTAAFDLSLFDDLLFPSPKSQNGTKKALTRANYMVSYLMNYPASRLTPLFATHPKNPPVTPFLATLPKSLDLKSFVCHTSEKQGGVGGILLTSPVCSGAACCALPKAGSMPGVPFAKGRLLQSPEQTPASAPTQRTLRLGVIVIPILARGVL